MEDMSIQTTEVNRLKEQIKSIEDEKKLAQIMHKNEVQKTNRLNEKMGKLEKKLTLKNYILKQILQKLKIIYAIILISLLLKEVIITKQLLIVIR